MMQKLWKRNTVAWTEREIIERESAARVCEQTIKDAWTRRNRAISFHRIETPILTPPQALDGHTQAGFRMIGSSTDDLLRPETTAGSIAVLEQMYPMANQRASRLPVCLWQIGKSFRDEVNRGSSGIRNMRLAEFWQMEFHLFAPRTTKADYIATAVAVLANRFGGKRVVQDDDLPHYSRRTLDWELDGMEIAGCSERTDWPEGVIYEVSIGLDRLVRKLMDGGE